MTEKELIKNLSHLKEARPDENWVIFCRQRLLKEILTAEKEPNLVFPGILTSLNHSLKGLFSHSLLKQAVSLILIFGVVFGTGLTTVARSKQSLPGQRLYPVKIALEQARLMATSSADNKSKLQSEIMALRLDELNRIIQTQEPMDSKQQKVEEVVINLQKQLLDIKNGLPGLEKAGSKKVVEAAKRIDESATSAKEALSQVKAALNCCESGQALTERIAEAVDAADKASEKALETMVQKQTEDQTLISQAEIITNLEGKVQSAEEKIKGVDGAVGNLVIGKAFPINADLIIDQSDKAKEMLEQAKELLRKNDFAAALQVIQAANEMIKTAEKMMDSAGSSPVQESSYLDSQNNASSGAATTSVQGANVSSE